MGLTTLVDQQISILRAKSWTVVKKSKSAKFLPFGSFLQNVHF